MESATYYARGDNPNAKNAWLNITNTRKDPVTALQFVATDGGDLTLEENGGQPDPDTLVRVDGVEMTFTFELSGTLPDDPDLADVNGVDMRGMPLATITTETGDRYVFIINSSITAEDMEEFPNGAQNVSDVNFLDDVILCFARGTQISTPTGETPVEQLVPGDLVLNTAGEAVELLWVVKRALSHATLLANPASRPIRIAKGAFGQKKPHSPLTVSPQHRVLVRDWKNELLFGCEDVLVPAKFLLGDLASQVCPKQGITYYHLLFENHEIIISNGLETESFQPAQAALDAQETETWDDFVKLGPAAMRDDLLRRPDACYAVKSYEAALLRRRNQTPSELA